MKGSSEQAGKIKVPKKVAFQVDNDLLTIGSDEPSPEMQPKPRPLAEGAGLHINDIDGMCRYADEIQNKHDSAQNSLLNNGIMIENMDHSIAENYKSQSSQGMAVKGGQKVRRTSIMEAAEIMDIDQASKPFQRQNQYGDNERPREKFHDGASGGQSYRGQGGNMYRSRRDYDQNDESDESEKSENPIVPDRPPVVTQKFRQHVGSQQHKKPQRDMYERFSQKHDPKWAAMISLLARNDIDLATKKIDKAEVDSHLEHNTKDYNVAQVNQMFAQCKCYLLKADRVHFQKVEERLLKIQNKLEGLLSITPIDTIKKELAGATTLNSKHMLEYRDFRWILQSYGLMGAFYNAMNMEKQCEGAYVRYVQIVEQFFNKDSLETSNAYFLVGIYYFEQSQTHKATACLRKALAIREDKFGSMHISCSDCLLNLGIIYKLRGLSEQARIHLERALLIRKEAVGVHSLPAASVHEELGKFYLEEKNFQESYSNLKQCYQIRKKIYSNKRVQDVERIATLLVFLHRKIELQIVQYKTSFEKGGLKLLTKLGSQLVSTINNVHAQMVEQASDTFSLLHADDDGFGETRSAIFSEQGSFMEPGASPANAVFRGRDEACSDSEYGGKTEIGRKEMIRNKEEQTERAMQNFKARGGMVQDVLDKRSSKASLYADLSADSDVEAYVKMGVQNVFSVADKVIQESYLPYAVSLMLSLSIEQLASLQEKQLALTSDDDPLYFSKQFTEGLDDIQMRLFKESKLWLIPRKQLVRKSDSDQLKDRSVNARDVRKGLYAYYSINLKHLKIPKKSKRGTESLSEQKKQDQTIFKFIQKVPKFIKELEASQTTLFKNVMQHNTPLRFFFLAIQPKQVEVIKDMIAGSDLAQKEAERLTWTFSMFLDPKENHESGFAHDIIQDQIEGNQGSGAGGLPGQEGDEDDAEYLNKRYADEIWLMIDDLKAHTEDDNDYLDDLEDLNPSKLGLDDDNFLSRELNHDAEDFKLQLGKYDDALRDSKDPLSVFEGILSLANTKILYLIYRQVKLVYNNRKQRDQKAKINRRTEDYDIGLHHHHQQSTRGLTYLNNGGGDLQHHDYEPDDSINERDESNQSEKVGSSKQHSLAKGARGSAKFLAATYSGSGQQKEFHDTFGVRQDHLNHQLAFEDDYPDHHNRQANVVMYRDHVNFNKRIQGRQEIDQMTKGGKRGAKTLADSRKHGQSSSKGELNEGRSGARRGHHHQHRTNPEPNFTVPTGRSNNMPQYDLERIKAPNCSLIKTNMQESLEDSVADLLRPQNPDDLVEDPTNSIETEIHVDQYDRVQILDQQEQFFEQLAQQNRNYMDYYENDNENDNYSKQYFGQSARRH